VQQVIAIAKTNRNDPFAAVKSVAARQASSR
jgi:hypothetical protein